MEKVPDVVGRIVGWRAWILHPLPLGGIGLWSIYARVHWPVGEDLVAECRRSKDELFSTFIAEHPESEDAPAEKCVCGIYAVSDYYRSDLQLYMSRATINRGWSSVFLPGPRKSIIVSGQVALWGKIRVGSAGYRAQYAKPLSLVKRSGDDEETQALAEEVAERYSIPLIDEPLREKSD